MYKSLILLLALSSSALASYFVDIKNNDGSKSFRFQVVSNADRACWCIKNTQTGTIKGVSGGTIKLFSSNDCTGNFQTIGSDGQVSNAQWVNSFSMGASNVPSSGPNGYCPNWYTVL